MNIPRYMCDENVKDAFLQFLKQASEAKNDKYCNFKEYDQLIKVFPMHSEVKQDLKTYIENTNVCIDITQSDDEADHNCRPIQKDDNHILYEINSILQNSCQDFRNNNNDDIIHSIRDSLCMQNEVSHIIQDLSNLSNDNLDEVFSSLSDHLSLEDIENFWKSLMCSNISNDYVITTYLKYLVLSRAQKEFTYELENIFLSLSLKYATILKSELVKVLSAIDVEEETNRVLLQYVGILKNDFKSDVLRQFIYTCEKLHSSYISIIEALLNPL